MDVAGPRRIAAQAWRVRLGKEKPKPKTPIRLCVARGRRAEKYHRRPSPGRETQSVGLRCEEGKEASEGDPNPPEPPTWIGSGLGLGQVIPSDCARASIRSRGAVGLTSQDRRAGGTHRLGGGSQSPRPKTFMHLTHFGPRAKSRDIPSTAEPWSRDAECWPPVQKEKEHPRATPPG